MVTIRNVRQISHGPPREMWDEKVFASPDGQWRIRLHDSFEWHMGAEGWKVSLHHAEQDVTFRHWRLVQGGWGQGYCCPLDLQPWSWDGTHLALCRWDKKPLLIYDVVRKERDQDGRAGRDLRSAMEPEDSGAGGRLL